MKKVWINTPYYINDIPEEVEGNHTNCFICGMNVGKGFTFEAECLGGVEEYYCLCCECVDKGKKSNGD